jgi:2-keto-4-pentenoate hydratase/2-oxohepta-3-ene-1,7-dioic acid hydratase in catechol pathway
VGSIYLFVLLLIPTLCVTVKETGHPLPKNPTLFIKPSPSIAEHEEAIPIPKTAQAMLDYEGELCIVIGKEGKNISEENALEYIAGYTVGNDVSARDWQTNPEMAGSRPQWCYGKSFDKFAPLGPALVSPKILKDCASSSLTTKVNGETRQSGQISDLVFGVAKLVAFCSNGQTVSQGQCVFSV